MMLVTTIQIIVIIFFVDGNLDQSMADGDRSIMEFRLRECILEGADTTTRSRHKAIFEEFTKWLAMKSNNAKDLFECKQPADVEKMDRAAFMKILEQVLNR